MGQRCSLPKGSQRRQAPAAVPPSVAAVRSDGGCPARVFFAGNLPLRARAEWGAAAQEAGVSGYNVSRYDLAVRAPGGFAVCDADAARQLLARHDGRSGDLSKPKKPGPVNELLTGSLTQSRSPDWHRQRTAVVAALRRC